MQVTRHKKDGSGTYKISRRSSNQTASGASEKRWYTSRKKKTGVRQ